MTPVAYVILWGRVKCMCTQSESLNLCNSKIWIFPLLGFGGVLLIFKVLFTVSRRATLSIYTDRYIELGICFTCLAGPWTEVYLHHQAVWRVTTYIYVHKHTDLSAEALSLIKPAPKFHLLPTESISSNCRLQYVVVLAYTCHVKNGFV